MIDLNGVRLTPDLSGALLWEDESTVVVADLHFEKASSYAERGQPLPPYDTALTLAALSDVIERLTPRRVICLGDSFHDPRAGERLQSKDAQALRALTGRAEWIWVAGNHDPDPPEDLGGSVVHDFCMGPLTFRHIARPDATAGEISGHFHPKASVPTRWRSVVRPCFAVSAIRVILPAFGSFTGGLNVRDPAMADLLSPDFEVVVLGEGKLHRFPSRALDRDIAMFNFK